MFTNKERVALSELFPPSATPDKRVPQIWAGMSARVWASFLFEHRHLIAPKRFGRLVTISLVILISSPFALAQSLLYRWRRIRIAPPVLVVGHWRSGTTLLHELLTLDKAAIAPTGYDCFAPHHSIVSGWILKPLLGLLMPKTRYVDSMAFELLNPQEDEFALLLMGAPSPYISLAFPTLKLGEMKADLDKLSLRQQLHFDRAAQAFFALMGRKKGKRLTLKSPLHAYRLARLNRLFPGLKVIHIVRDPRAVLPSTFNAISLLQGLFALGHTPASPSAADRLEAYLAYFNRFEEERKALAADQLVEITFEALIADPLATLEKLYQDLKLGDFSSLRETLTSRLAGLKSYQPSNHNLSQAQRQAIEHHTAHIMARYGYRRDSES